MPLSSSPFPAPSRRGLRAALFLGAASLLTSLVAALAGPASAAPAPAVAPAEAPGAAPAPAAPVRSGPVPVSSLTMTGTATNVTVHRIFRNGQAQWVSHVLDTRLGSLDQCQAQRSRADRRNNTYRATVRSVCVDGTARTEAAARALVADRPWYRVRVTRVPLVGFSLVADLPSGNDRAVPAALAELPKGDFTFAEGDDLSLNYVGRGVTQAQLDAAVAAFAKALKIPANQVEVAPLAG